MVMDGSVEEPAWVLGPWDKIDLALRSSLASIQPGLWSLSLKT